MNYAIHKSLNYTAQDVQSAIETETELPGCSIQIWQDGWIIVEPEGVAMDDWTRNKCEYICLDSNGFF